MCFTVAAWSLFHRCYLFPTQCTSVLFSLASNLPSSMRILTGLFYQLVQSQVTLLNFIECNTIQIYVQFKFFVSYKINLIFIIESVQQSTFYLNREVINVHKLFIYCIYLYEMNLLMINFLNI